MKRLIQILPMCFLMALATAGFVSCHSEDENSDVYVAESGPIVDAVFKIPTNINLLPSDFGYSYDIQDANGNWNKQNVALTLKLHGQDGKLFLTRDNFYDQPNAILSLDSVGVVQDLSDIDASKISAITKSNYSTGSSTGTSQLIAGCGYIAKYEARRKIKYSPFVVSSEDNEYQQYTIYARIFIKEKVSDSTFNIRYQAPWKP